MKYRTSRGMADGENILDSITQVIDTAQAGAQTAHDIESIWSSDPNPTTQNYSGGSTPAPTVPAPTAPPPAEETNYLPWVLGGVAALGLLYVATK